MVKVIAMSNLRRQLSPALEAAVAGEPVVITDYQRPVAVFVSLAEYERLSGQKLVFSLTETWPAGARFEEVPA